MSSVKIYCVFGLLLCLASAIDFDFDVSPRKMRCFGEMFPA